MVNNIEPIYEMIKEYGLLGKPILVVYRRRRKDVGDRTRTITKDLYKNINRVVNDYDNIIKICESNQARCYITIVEPMFAELFKVIRCPMETFMEWKSEKWKETAGVHLIDCDDLSQESSIIEWLTQNGAIGIHAIPSKTGSSILFRSTWGILEDYMKTEYNTRNTIHPAAHINLYIPDSVLSIDSKSIIVRDLDNEVDDDD